MKIAIVKASFLAKIGRWDAAAFFRTPAIDAEVVAARANLKRAEARLARALAASAAADAREAALRASGDVVLLAERPSAGPAEVVDGHLDDPADPVRRGDVLGQ